ncbi:MAG: DUF3891 family protein [Roseococcus sp.]|nr:DUF3891 family protein [Roseococcus sp.]
MILWPQEDGSVLATPQPAHALIAGQLMRALADPPAPFEPVCTAAAQHDCAWMPWEEAPEFDASTGLPRHFNALSGAEHVPMWEKGVETALANWGLWVGLLILMHGTHIYRMGILGNRMAPSAESRAAMEGYMAREAPRRAALMARLGVTEREVRPQQRKLALVDGVALGLCWGQPRFDCAGSTLIRTGPFAATLHPWPLAPAALVVETEALRLPGRFPDAAAMRAGLAAAPRETLRFTLARA